MTTKTIKGVELVKVGTWSASTGKTTVTRDDLNAMVTAYGDPQVDRAAIKIGHTDDRFGTDATGDGEPAFGWVENPRVSDDGTTLLGDLVGIPAKLAEVIPAAFRRRSVEIAWGLKTAAGAVHRAALTGLALLGVAKPAVKGMADVLALYGADKPGAGVTAIEMVDGLDPAAIATLAAARAEVAAFAATYSVPEETLVTALERIDRLSGMNDTATVPPAVDEPSDGADGTAGKTAPTTKEEPRMSLNEQRVRELLKLEADADVEAAIKALVDKPADEGVTPPEGTPAEGTPATGTPTTPPAGEGTPAGTPADGTVTLSAGQWAEVQAAAAAGQTAANELAKQRRDGIITAALGAGKITVHESAKFREQLDKDEAGTVALLTALTPGRRTNTVELGTDLTGASLFAAGAAANADAWTNDAADLFGVDLTGGK